MASSTKFAILFAGALCLLCLPGMANSAATQFIVEGDVYCEVCRTNFINKLSQPMPGAKVKLQCKGEEEGNITYSLEGVTDAKGHYRLTVEGDHGEEACEVTLLKSSRADCEEIPDEGWATKPSSKVTLTKNNGFHGETRQANPLGFTRKKADPQCFELFKELEINPNQEF
ncbi:hypothetical protein CDL12_14327 [Handroanthus impetiginosus]|uniref:Pollen allergen Ole e 1 family n=1 Tax=Handroanthus impetiginosus TaxID=429701 RepID=A0A2G9H697_9LAMI|nr:hypothetical protein CDL12_14327 [Handroanthus impetiginosus]